MNSHELQVPIQILSNIPGLNPGEKRILGSAYQLVCRCLPFIALAAILLVGIAAIQLSGPENAFALDEARAAMWARSPRTDAAPTAFFTYTTYLPLMSKPPCAEASLYGVVFQDMNGNGIRDEAYQLGSITDHPDGWLGAVGPVEEPAIPGVVLKAGTYEATSMADGRYALCVPSGWVTVTIEAEPYRYLLPSVWKIHDLDDGLEVNVNGLTELDLGLGIGFLTAPYRLSDSAVFRQGSYVDIDPTLNQVGVYYSIPEVCDLQVCTHDAHRGVDFGGPDGSAVVAPAPGFVYSVGSADDGSPMIVIVHTEYEGLEPWTGDRIRWGYKGIETSYQHLGEIAKGIVPGVFVHRGQLLGYIGDSDTMHLDTAMSIPDTTMAWLDPFRDLFHDEFTLEDHWDHGGYYIKISQGSPGFWTADNIPSFSP